MVKIGGIIIFTIFYSKKRCRGQSQTSCCQPYPKTSEVVSPLGSVSHIQKEIYKIIKNYFISLGFCELYIFCISCILYTYEILLKYGEIAKNASQKNNQMDIHLVIFCVLLFSSTCCCRQIKSVVRSTKSSTLKVGIKVEVVVFELILNDIVDCDIINESGFVLSTVKC